MLLGQRLTVHLKKIFIKKKRKGFDSFSHGLSGALGLGPTPVELLT